MEAHKKILIIEDDQEISHLLRLILSNAGFDAIVAYSGTEGMLQLESNRFDLILLDLMLPGLTGEELIKKIKQRSGIPIIVISAKSNIDEKVQVLQLGAEDYITKPFHTKEVLARIEVQLRNLKVRKNHNTEKHWRDLLLHTEKRTVFFKGYELSLTNAEYDILNLFMNHPERAFSKKEIYEKVWKGHYYGDDNTISVHVSNIRKKISLFSSDSYIKTVWGVGFMLI
ncbi:response regulator transcription factor [Alkalihalobacillus trypoxylicola]|uniref:XRE family transcriptional regulator n=1 Tax=Alkalihalobacillus trypoxylicola TaxID=519424 RepID=A0A161QEK9_9BACI|nr:response regulator transcription factor [Alkalihalobacillus trypoxylicola]KYG26987.1 XRE family transcriptional regulator [Alkalihalobacillus trypoxylicola]